MAEYFFPSFRLFKEMNCWNETQTFLRVSGEQKKNCPINIYQSTSFCASLILKECSKAGAFFFFFFSTVNNCAQDKIATLHSIEMRWVFVCKEKISEMRQKMVFSLFWWWIGATWSQNYWFEKSDIVFAMDKILWVPNRLQYDVAIFVYTCLGFFFFILLPHLEHCYVNHRHSKLLFNIDWHTN